jgi:hypothetical protein
MMYWCVAVAAFGLVLMGAAFASTDGAARALLTVLGGVAPAMDAALRFAIGLMGAVTFGWGLTMLAVASASDRLDPAAARLVWTRIAWALGAWYVVDGAISAATGFGWNVASNTLLALTFVLIARRAGVLAPPTGVQPGRHATAAL